MLARIRKAQDNEEGGFTLIELLVVIIIIGILAAIAIPTFLNQRQKGFDAQAKSDLRNVAGIVESNFVDFSAYPTTLTDSQGTNALTTVFYKASANAKKTAMGIVMVDATGKNTTAAQLDKTVGYCLAVQSDSDSWFGYNSVKGGLQTYATAPTSLATACPAT